MLIKIFPVDCVSLKIYIRRLAVLHALHCKHQNYSPSLRIWRRYIRPPAPVAKEYRLKAARRAAGGPRAAAPAASIDSNVSCLAPAAVAAPNANAAAFPLW